MAPIIKWQRWDSSNYNWFGTAATDALPAMTEQLGLWIADVNGNESNVNRQLIIERDASSSTSTNYAGLVISAGADGTTDRGYMTYACFGSTSARRLYVGNAYDNGIGNGGYGIVSGLSSDTSIAFRTSGHEANWLLIYDNEDGKEFFTFGPTFSSRSSGYEDGFTIFKRTTGEWCMVTGDGTSQYPVSYVNTSQFTGWTQPNRRNTSSNSRVDTRGVAIGRYTLLPNTTASTSVIDEDFFWVAANPNLMAASGTSTYYDTGDRVVLTDLGDGTNVYLVTSYHYGPMVLMDLSV